MKLIGFFTIISAYMLLSPPATLADSCAHHEREVQRYTDLRRGGGSGAQMNNWHRQRNHHKREMDKCNPANSNGSVATATGKSKQQKHAQKQDKIEITTSDHVLRKHQETCNYWIEQFNRTGKDFDKSHRDISCRQAGRPFN